MRKNLSTCLVLTFFVLLPKNVTGMSFFIHYLLGDVENRKGKIYNMFFSKEFVVPEWDCDVFKKPKLIKSLYVGIKIDDLVKRILAKNSDAKNSDAKNRGFLWLVNELDEKNYKILLRGLGARSCEELDKEFNSLRKYFDKKFGNGPGKEFNVTSGYVLGSIKSVIFHQINNKLYEEGDKTTHKVLDFVYCPAPGFRSGWLNFNGASDDTKLTIKILKDYAIERNFVKNFLAAKKFNDIKIVTKIVTKKVEGSLKNVEKK